MRSSQTRLGANIPGERRTCGATAPTYGHIPSTRRRWTSTSTPASPPRARRCLPRLNWSRCLKTRCSHATFRHHRRVPTLGLAIHGIGPEVAFSTLLKQGESFVQRFWLGHRVAGIIVHRDHSPPLQPGGASCTPSATTKATTTTSATRHDRQTSRCALQLALQLWVSKNKNPKNPSGRKGFQTNELLFLRGCYRFLRTPHSSRRTWQVAQALK